MKPKDAPPSEVKSITREINKIIDSNFQVTTDDTEVNELISSDWADLTSLKDELAGQVLNLVHNVTSISTNPEVTQNIIHKENFAKLVEIFFADVNDYSSKIKAIRSKHEHRTGKVLNVEEQEAYNQLAVEYYGLSEELIHVLAPTVTELVIMSNADVQTKLKEMEVTDVQPK